MAGRVWSHGPQQRKKMLLEGGCAQRCQMLTKSKKEAESRPRNLATWMSSLTLQRPILLSCGDEQRKGVGWRRRRLVRKQTRPRGASWGSLAARRRGQEAGDSRIVASLGGGVAGRLPKQSVAKLGDLLSHVCGGHGTTVVETTGQVGRLLPSFF